MKILTTLMLLILTVSCQNGKIDYSYPEHPENIRKQRAGKFFSDIDLFKKNKSSKTNINSSNKNQLWLVAIEVISTLIPIDTADRNSGLIITEWYQDGKNERIKINLVIKGDDFKKENIIPTIFRQKQDSKGNWVDDKSANQDASQLIIDKIFSRLDND